VNSLVLRQEHPTLDCESIKNTAIIWHFYLISQTHWYGFVMENGYLIVGTMVGMGGSELLACSDDIPYGNP
jgi:hypothetical protein